MEYDVIDHHQDVVVEVVAADTALVDDQTAPGIGTEIVVVDVEIFHHVNVKQVVKDAVESGAVEND